MIRVNVALHQDSSLCRRETNRSHGQGACYPPWSSSCHTLECRYWQRGGKKTKKELDHPNHQTSKAAILSYSDTPSADSEDVFTPEEQEVFHAEDTKKGVQAEEVNMNLRGGKVLSEPLKIKPTRVPKPAASKEAPLQEEVREE